MQSVLSPGEGVGDSLEGAGVGVASAGSAIGAMVGSTELLESLRELLKC